MDRLKEEKFVNNFIVKEKRQRLLYELCSPKKREQAIQKLSCATDDKFVVFCGATNRDELYNFVARLSDVRKDCYVIADDDDDGRQLAFGVAFEHMCMHGGEYLILCGDNVVIIKQEYVSGAFSVTVLNKQ